MSASKPHRMEECLGFSSRVLWIMLKHLTPPLLATVALIWWFA